MTNLRIGGSDLKTLTRSFIEELVLLAKHRDAAGTSGGVL
jgi:hypothetical protein